MLTDTQRDIVRKTVPILKDQGEAIASHMYQRMFEQDPEVKLYFNPVHQIEGTQPRALARAIIVYAQHVDEPEVLTDAVELIAQKHASLTIKPEHYPIVGRNLLASIREVLGDGATDEVIDAWAAAYGMLADIFIEREQQIYTGQEQTFGWHDHKEFVVARREPASDNIESVYLEPADGHSLETQKAGQYIGIQKRVSEDRVAMRNYSLSNAPGASYYRISVKRELAPNDQTPDGVFSNYLHDHLAVGDRVLLTPPCGNFTLELPTDPQKPVVFIAGGVGVTPLLSMLHDALDRSTSERPLIFIQAVENGAVHPFKDEIGTLIAEHDNLKVHVRYSKPSASDREHGRFDSEGYVDDALLESLVGDRSAVYYFCGPPAMMGAVDKILEKRDVSSSDRRFEYFGPAGDDVA
ncbi:NO-inducible flavohemoprotein [Halomonas sp. PR-M31]|uniref:NO-inducible flavohemoprotein n=1 Tax=Halomonas sp. PR-M31 TaxID=1471202 RepID=UPI0006501C0C|nr:NO-inducible flavohemoprotein [Halomonas sp. PR-M31]